MFTDYVLNGQANGEVAGQLAGCHFDAGLLRPYRDKHGHQCVTVNTGEMRYDEEKGLYVPVYEKRLLRDVALNTQLPIFNTTLRKDEWLMLDRAVVRAARQRLRAWADLAGANTFGGFNGMSKLVLEHETMSDPGEAVQDFEGLTEGRADAPKFQLEGLPLPITHSDFWFSSRRLAVSRNTGTPLDSTMAEAAGRRVGELIEQQTIGSVTGLTYGNGSYGRNPTVYGYTNFPDRNTKTDLTAPTGSNADVTLDEVLEMIETMANNRFYGPFMLYHSTDWDKFMDDDYRAQDTRTLRMRLRQIDAIVDVRRLDFLTDTYTLLLVQMTPEVCRAVVGMDVTTVQWESQGGMRVNFKVMCIKVPQLRADYNSRCGIMHATTA